MDTLSIALRLVAEPTRLEILRLVWSQERSAGEIAGHFPVTFGAVSQHLGQLLGAGLLRRRRDGHHLYYTANREALGPLATALQAMWTERLDTLKSLAEQEQRKIDAGIAKTSRPKRKNRKENP
jgi:DNA-binding transcriptional ArsR family regulator